jgi:hypothetical protein
MMDFGSRLIWSCALLGSMGTTALSEASDAPCLAVVDGRGKTAGALFDEVITSDNGLIGARVAVDVRGRIYTVTVDANGVTGGDEGVFFVSFETTDCSGSPFITIQSLNGSSLLPRTSVASPSTTLYAQVPGELEHDVAFQSVRRLGDETCQPFPVTQTAVKAEAIIDLTTRFEPPLSVRTRCTP